MKVRKRGEGEGEGKGEASSHDNGDRRCASNATPRQDDKEEDEDGDDNEVANDYPVSAGERESST